MAWSSSPGRLCVARATDTPGASGHRSDGGDPFHDGCHFDSRHQCSGDVKSPGRSGRGLWERLGTEIGQRGHTRTHPALAKTGQPLGVRRLTLDHPRDLLQAGNNLLLHVGHPRGLPGQHALELADLRLELGNLLLSSTIWHGRGTGHSDARHVPWDDNAREPIRICWGVAPSFSINPSNSVMKSATYPLES